jgi:hypothetical protein
VAASEGLTVTPSPVHQAGGGSLLDATVPARPGPANFKTQSPAPFQLKAKLPAAGGALTWKPGVPASLKRGTTVAAAATGKRET